MSLTGTFLRIARVLRLPLAAGSAVAAGALFSQAASTYNYVLMDYLAWIAFLGILLAVVGDFSANWRRCGYASTLTLGLVGLGMAFIGRISSTALSLWRSGITSPIIGGSIAGEDALALALVICPASVICLGAVLVSTINRKPVSFGSTVTYYEVFGVIWSKVGKTWSFIGRHPVPFAFLLGLSVRAIPEIIWWPWLVGWDTVEYAAHLEDFLADPRLFSAYYWMGSMRNMPPMIDWVLAAPAAALGSQLVYKLYPPVAYGILVGLVALVSKRVLGMDGKQALIASALSALFILNLRISWDYLRQVLGTLFLLGFLAVQGELDRRMGDCGGLKGNLGLESTGSGRNGSCRRLAWGVVFPLLLLLGSALSHEVTAFASAAILLYLLSESAAGRRYVPAAFHAVAFACTALLLVWYYGRPFSSSTYFGSVPVGIVSNPSESMQVISYLVAGLGAVLPLAFTRVREIGGTYKVALLGLIAAGITPLIVPYTSVVTWYRFLIGVAPIAAPLAVKAVLDSGRRETLAVLALLVVVPGTVYLHPNGGYYTSMLTGAYREFPQNMVPCPASGESQEAIMGAAPVAASFIGAFETDCGYDTAGGTAKYIPLVAQADDARFVHLFVRNPDPKEFVWLNNINGWTINSTMNRMGVDEVFFITRIKANALNQSVNSFTYVGSFKYFEISQILKNEDNHYYFYKISRVTSTEQIDNILNTLKIEY